MKEELKQIMEELREVIREEELNISDDEYFDVAIRLYLTDEINKKRKENYLKSELSPKERLEPQDNDGLATPNQIAFLKKTNVQIPNKLTKKEAYLMIKKIKG